MAQSMEQAEVYSRRWLDIIQRPAVTEDEGKEIIRESLVNFAEHFNRGWLDYRKSVTEAGDWAATEWTGSGAIFRDVLGREYIDASEETGSSRTAGPIRRSWMPCEPS
jgi:putrescine aminotransferase